MPTAIQTDDVTKYLIAIGHLDAGGGRKMAPPKAKVADYTIVTGTDPSGTLFTNRGAGAAVVFTLPTPVQALAGVFYDFVSIADFALSIKTAAVDTMVILNDVAGKQIGAAGAATMIGSYIRVICDGVQWIGAGLSVGTVYTHTA